jgi:PAS domain S-box-containing protein
LDARAHLKGHDEITDLGNSFDRMARRLGKTLAGLNAAEHFLQNVIDAIPDGVRVIDDDFNIIKANNAYCRQTGQSMEEVIGGKCYRSSHGREEPCPVTLISCPVMELRNSSPSIMKARHQHKSFDGGELFVEISAARVNLIVDGKETPCIIESIRDLAEQANISHEQRLSEIGLLATGVAHEIHNPLSSIQLALKAIQVDLENPKGCQTNLEYFDIAETEIAKCLKVTDGLMMLSEPPGDMVSLIALDEIIPDVFSLLSYQSEQAGISVVIDLPREFRVIASDSDMRMIVINLAQNAFHAMPNGGDFTVTGRHVGAMIELVFADTGLGIPKANQEKIFLPFWTKRIDASEGRGLGLSICKAIIDRFDGEITVKSKVGSGTRFTILLPCADVDG